MFVLQNIRDELRVYQTTKCWEKSDKSKNRKYTYINLIIFSDVVSHNVHLLDSYLAGTIRITNSMS